MTSGDYVASTSVAVVALPTIAALEILDVFSTSYTKFANLLVIDAGFVDRSAEGYTRLSLYRDVSRDTNRVRSSVIAFLPEVVTITYFVALTYNFSLSAISRRDGGISRRAFIAVVLSVYSNTSSYLSLLRESSLRLSLPLLYD